MFKGFIFLILAVVSFSGNTYACEGCESISDALCPVKLNLDKVKMQVVQTDSNGVFNPKITLQFSQVNRAVSAEYCGGKIRSGFLVGKFLAQNRITFNYCQMLEDGTIVTGVSLYKVIKNDEGKITLIEDAQGKPLLREHEMNVFRQI